MSYPVPTLVKEMRGTLQENRRVENEPNPPAGALDAPDWMTEAQRNIWRSTLAVAPADLFRMIDEAILAQYVVAYDLYQTASKDIAKNGYTTRGHRGALLASPSVHVMNQQAVTMRLAIQELGFSPAARTRINSLADGLGGGDASDEWSQLTLIS